MIGVSISVCAGCGTLEDAGAFLTNIWRTDSAEVIRESAELRKRVFRTFAPLLGATPDEVLAQLGPPELVERNIPYDKYDPCKDQYEPSPTPAEELWMYPWRPHLYFQDGRVVLIDFFEFQAVLGPNGETLFPHEMGHRAKINELLRQGHKPPFTPEALESVGLDPKTGRLPSPPESPSSAR